MGDFLYAFGFTQLVEAPIYARAIERPPRVAWALGASALTHPVVWFVFPALWPGGYWSMVLVAEAFAVGVESLYLRALGVRRALAWSLLANGASFLLGLLGDLTGLF